MKTLHLNTFQNGGAANAGYRLHQGLIERGLDSIFGVKSRAAGGRRTVVAAPSGLKHWYAEQSHRIEFHFAKWRWPSVRPVLSAYQFPGVCRGLIREIQPDIVNLHWVDQNFVSISDLHWMARSGIPIVWTVHDMCPLSGGFGYREDVGLPATPFGPLICEGAGMKISEDILRRRSAALKGARLTVVSPSKWLADEARNSPVFAEHKVVHIPNGISDAEFFPEDAVSARSRFSLPQDRKIVLFGSLGFDHSRKGLQHLKEAIRILAELSPTEEQPLLVCFGNDAEIPAGEFALPIRGLGLLHSVADLRAVYSMADLFVCPSREDNLPNTIVESLACGTPVVGFDVGGVPDLLAGMPWGEIVPSFNERELAVRIKKWLVMPSVENRMRREQAKDFACAELTLRVQTGRYLAVYNELLSH